MRGRFPATLLLAAASAAASGAAFAHDTWLRTASSGRGLEVATGTHYPVAQFPTNPTSVIQPGCSDGANKLALRPFQVNAESLSMLPVTRGQPVLSCWVELAEYTVDLTPEIVPLYLDEVHASPRLRALSAQRERDGKGWHERYRKFMRIEYALPQASAAARAAARQPAGYGLELVVVGDQPLAVGTPVQVQLLRDGKPLADQAIELVDDQGHGQWSSTDAQGMLTQVLPSTGAWLLRGVDLRPAVDGTWDSRFVTLLLDLR